MTKLNESSQSYSTPGATEAKEVTPVAEVSEAGSKEAEKFSADYVKELRRENAHFRTRAKEQEELAQKALEEAQKLSQELKQEAEARIIQAELKAVALKAGMFDLDGLKLADISAVRLEEDGQITGADALMAQLKKDKPYLFSTALSSSTHTGRAPSADTVKPRRASEMTAEEYAAAKAAVVRGGW